MSKSSRTNFPPTNRSIRRIIYRIYKARWDKYLRTYLTIITGWIRIGNIISKRHLRIGNSQIECLRLGSNLNSKPIPGHSSTSRNLWALLTIPLTHFLSIRHSLFHSSQKLTINLICRLFIKYSSRVINRINRKCWGLLLQSLSIMCQCSPECLVSLNEYMNYN